MTNKIKFTDVNTITVSGNLTKDPVITTVKTPFGDSTRAMFTIANNQRNNVNWLFIQCLGKVADVAKQLTKGKSVMITGRLQTSRSNEDKTYTYIKPYRINEPVKPTHNMPKINTSDLPF